jgi:type IV secretion system protein VirB10
VSHPEDKQAKPDKTILESPTGLDLHPAPESSPRISKRVGIIIAAAGVLVLGGFAYGGYRRSLKAQADGKSQGLLRSLAPATDTDIIKGIPAGNAAIARHPVAPPTYLEPPEEVSGQSANPCMDAGTAGHVIRFNPETGQPCATPMERLVIRRAPPPPVGAIRPATAHEPSAQEKALLEESVQEHAAMVAPTAIHASEPGGLSAGRESSTAPQNDLSTLAALSRSLPQNGGNATMTSAAAATGDNEYDGQNDQARKESFLQNASAHQTDDYLRSTREAPLSRFEIKTGWDIPAILEQGLNSDLPGELKALVTVNVYDTATGQYLLIPQGSRLIGKYDSRVSYGQSGVQVVWNRVVFPDASTVDLNGMEGLDSQGNAGLRDKVDRHYKRLFGSAALSSLFSAAFDVTQRQNQSVLNYPSPAQTAEASVSRNMSETGSEITRRNLNVQPTIKVPVGYRFTVRVNRDILFESPYEPIQPDLQSIQPRPQLRQRSSSSSQ